MTHTIHRVLIANRGEIARRIIRTCHNVGYETVAVYSEADKDALFVAEADVALCIGPPAPKDSYLHIEALVQAALRTHAQAVHPGYGFLSENPDFAQAVIDAGLIWVGPSPKSIRAMANKAAARKQAVSLGIPVLPGFDTSDDASDLRAAASTMGFPLLIKAVSGGGGRGMRRVDALDQFDDALASARREARSAFGDDRVMLERLLQRPRHIEVQIMGDGHGEAVHLFERDCSIQRRNQKIVEEAPAPMISPDLRQRMGQAACTLAKAVHYAGAGTVEFLVADDQFYFLEMNTRLQVEHPVTEEITGQDLVAWQLSIAAGNALPCTQEQVAMKGHSIEVRIYAEDPMQDYLPGTGALHHVQFVDMPGIRIEAGVQAGDTVRPWYDSMLCKLIATGADRPQAIQRLKRALDKTWITGLATNLPLLRQIAHHPSFMDPGTLQTSFLGDQGLPQAPPTNPALGCLAATALGLLQRMQDKPSWFQPGFRLAGVRPQVRRYRCFANEILIRYRPTLDDGLGFSAEVTVDNQPTQIMDVKDLVSTPTGLRWTVQGVRSTIRVAQPTQGGRIFAHLGHGESAVDPLPRHPRPAPSQGPPGALIAPTPGTVIRVETKVGASVSQGDVLVVLEAMKMEHRVKAPVDGIVQSLRVAKGDVVEQGVLLVQVANEAGEQVDS